MSVLISKVLQTTRAQINDLLRQHYFPRWLVFAMDHVIVLSTFYLAYLLRFNFVTQEFTIPVVLQQGLFVLLIYMLFSLAFRSYTGLIRHTTIIDVFFVLLSTSSSLIILLVIDLVIRRFGWPLIYNIPLSILLIHYVIITLFLCFIRIVIKIFYQIITSSITDKRKVLIYGAGAMGVIAKRVLQSDVKSYYQIAGFLDRNKALQGKKINSIRVYSPSILTSQFVQKNNIKAMMFAIRDIGSDEKSEIFKTALSAGLEVMEVPRLENWFNGQFNTNEIKKIKLEDLLGREPIKLNIKKIGLGLIGKTVLVTGAAGSIGSEIVRQLANFKIKMLILTDQAETPMFNIENELKSFYNQCPVKLVLADITNYEKMDGIFREFQPEIVFHAAAYKHVPLIEENPHEAIRVNIGGTKVITKLSLKYSVKKFVMISTDKAVNPTNIMGASKRLCEMIVQLKSQKVDNKTQFIITRFGNVLGSNGSVIPTFTKQIEAGGPVTVTHPEITRYFMTIPEACQLVLEAGFMGHGGEIYVFDMGKPIKIVDLANQMIRLSGLTPEKDIKIEFTGLRPGEKLYEELLADEERTRPTHHPKIKIAKVKPLESPGLLIQIETILVNLYKLSDLDVIRLFKELVPEYSCTNEKYKLAESENISDDDKTKMLDSFETLKSIIENNNPD